MVKFVRTDVAQFDPERKQELARVMAALSAEASLPGQREVDRRDAALIAEGRLLLASAGMRCTECHQFHKPDEDAVAPDLTGYGSRELAHPIHRQPRSPPASTASVTTACPPLGRIMCWTPARLGCWPIGCGGIGRLKTPKGAARDVNVPLRPHRNCH